MKQMDAKALVLLKEAAEWRLIGLLFECPEDGWREQVTALAAGTTDARLQEAAAACGEATAGLYHTTFGPGGPAAVREVSHREGVLPGPTLAELYTLYEAFAYKPAISEPPDHVAVETGFVAYLRFKEAYARLLGDREKEEICANASRTFIDEHLTALAHPLADALAESGITYLALAGEALRSRVGPPPPMAIPLAVSGDEAEEMI